MKRGTAAFTLVELLVVIAIMSMIMGIGSAFYTHFDRKFILQSTAGQLVSACKAAQSFARQEQEGVRISQAQGQIETWGHRLTGFWHCEDLVTTGAFNRHARPDGATLAPGKVGKSLQFTPGKSRLECGVANAAAMRQGFALSLWIYPQRPPQNAAQTIYRSGLLQIHIGVDGMLTVDHQSGKWNAVAALPLYQWTWFELRYEKTMLTLHVNRQRIFGQQILHAEPDQSIVLAPSFQGRLDEIRLTTLSMLDSLTLPTGVTLLAAPEHIFFDSQGRLDPLRHTGSLQIVLEGRVLRQTQRASIVISLMGEVDWQIGNARNE